MKRCPTCNRTYPDDALSFCLEDGVTLLPVASPQSGGGSYDPNATMVLPETRDTEPPATQILGFDQVPQMPYTPPNVTTPPAYPWTPTPQPPPQPSPPTPAPPVAPPPVVAPNVPAQVATGQKKSALPWLAIGGGILALLVLGVVGIIGIAAYLGSKDENTNKNGTPKATPKPTEEKKTGGDTKSPPYGGAAFSDDFSQETWPAGEGIGKDCLYRDGEYVMQHKTADEFIIIYGPSDEYATNSATKVSVTAQSLDAKGQQYGHGLVIDGDLTTGEQLNGYVFLVDPPKKQISIALLNKGQPTFLTQGKSAPMVYPGTGSNKLEVRLNGKQMDFYVNDELAGSANKTIDLQGRAGLFTGAGGQVAFDDLEITK